MSNEQNAAQDPQLVIRNLQSACNELQFQRDAANLRNTQLAVERDRVVEYAKQLEERVKILAEQLEKVAQANQNDGPDEIFVEPAPATKKPRKAA